MSDYDPIARKYDAVFSTMEVRKQEFAWLLKHAGFQVSDIVLDYGCGNGILLKTIAGRIKEGIGMDASAGMIELARGNLSEIKNCRVVHLSAQPIPLPDNSVDAVISFFSFRYMDAERIIREFVRVTRPQGRILIVDMAAREKHWQGMGIADYFHIVADTLLERLRLHRIPGLYKKLNSLVRDPGWKSMLRKNPVRPLAEFREIIGRNFHGVRFSVINQGLRAVTTGVCIKPLGLFCQGKRQGIPSICVMDWGIGGMGFYSLFKKTFPDTAVMYLSDTGFIPYGKAGKKQLRKRLDAIIRVIAASGVGQLVIACNAMSSVLEGYIPPVEIQITGVIQPTVAAVAAIKKAEGFSQKTIGVIGGKRTIRSRAYQNGLSASGKRVCAVPSQRLSAYIEAGDTHKTEVRRYLISVLGRLKKCGALILGCTHYAAVAGRIHSLLPVPQIDPAACTLEFIHENWRIHSHIPGRAGAPDLFLTTGDPAQMKTSALKMFGVDVEAIHRVLI